MDTVCWKCGHEPQKVRASLRRTLAQCEDCGKTYCTECLKQMAIDRELVSETDADLILDQAGAEGFLRKCAESGDNLCPNCFEGVLEIEEENG